MDQCYGIAFYANPDVVLERLPDAELAWPPEAPAGAARKVWVVAAMVRNDRRELFIDQETSRFLQEVTPQSARIYWDFRAFDGMVMPGRILEITKTRQGESRTPFTWANVQRNVPIEDWRFAEYMPKR